MANSLDFTKSQLEKLKQILEYPNDFKYPLGTKVVADDPEFLNKEGLGGKWKQIEGAFIFGASDSYPVDNEIHGSAEVVLTKAQIPSHSHGLNVPPAQHAGDWASGHYSGGYIPKQRSGNYVDFSGTTATGGNEAHENMPPYIAKYMWIKTKLESETNGILEIYVWWILILLKMVKVSIFARGGVALSVNGEEILTDKILENLLNKKYPVGSKFIFPSGSENPASYVGGDWIKVASSVNLPLGTSASVKFNANGNAVKFLKSDGSHAFFNGTATLKGANVNNVDPVLNVQLDANAGYNFNAIIDPQGTLVATANDWITIDIWQRLS